MDNLTTVAKLDLGDMACLKFFICFKKLCQTKIKSVAYCDSSVFVFYNRTMNMNVCLFLLLNGLQ